MHLNSIRWRLMLSYAAIAMLAALSLGMVLRTILRDYYSGQEARYLEGRAIEIGSIASQLLSAGLPDEVIREQTRSWSFFLQARVRIENADGKLIADSGLPDGPQIVFIRNAVPFPVGLEAAPGGAPSESFQIEIRKASTPGAGGVLDDVIVFNQQSVGVAMPVDSSIYGLLDPGTETPLRRSSQVIDRELIGTGGNPIGRLILSEGPAYGDEILKNVTNGWIVAGVAAVLFAALAGWLVSNRITTPLTELTDITSRMSRGDLSARADIRTGDEIGTLGRSFNEMAGRVEETVATLRSFVEDAAHELHTPLTALQTNLELTRESNDAPARSLYLARALEQSRRLEALAGSLLDLSRIEAGQARSRFVPVDFSRLVSEIAEQFASRAEQAEREFELKIGVESALLLGDDDQLRQVVINLLENSIKFTPRNGSIMIRLEAAGDQVKFNVTDSGIGIPSDDLPHLFERFHRGRNAAEYAGSGLGLAIVRAIVIAHRGTVTIESPEQRGTSVSISLPIHLAE